LREAVMTVKRREKGGKGMQPRPLLIRASRSILEKERGGGRSEQ